MINGNMMLTIPLASLPAGRGTTPGYTVSLHYNSKNWDANREFRKDGFDDGTSTANYTRELIRLGEQGGWHLDYGQYRLGFVNRLELEGEAPCVPNTGENEYRRNGYAFKLEMALPNGSIVQFHPYGSGPDYAQYPGFQNGFYPLDPYGVRHHYSWAWDESRQAPLCSTSQVQVTTAGINYYTDDGSRLRLFIPYQPGVPVVLMNWKLFFPDGRVVENSPLDEPGCVQRTTDRNGNRIFVRLGSLNGMSGTKIENDTGHFIFITAGFPESKIIQPGAGGEQLETTLRWTSQWVYHNYVATHAFNANPAFINADLFQDLSLLERIILPAQAGSLEYAFTYYASPTRPTTGNYTEGWGQLASMTLPGGAKAEYSYGLTGDFPGMDSTVLSADVVTTRKLIYTTEYDGQMQQVSETTTYSTGGGTGGVCSPHANCQTHVSAIGGNLHGYAYRIAETSGSVVEKIWVSRRLMPNGTFVSVEPFVKTEFTSIPDAAGNPVLTATKDFEYDQNGNLLEVKEYDWVPYSSIPRSTTGDVNEFVPVPRPAELPSGLVLKRRTINTYYNGTPNKLDPVANSPNHYANPSAPRLLTLLKSTEVLNGNGSVVSRSEYFYDGVVVSPTKGNVTETRIWDSTKGDYTNPLMTSNSISTSTEYDAFGSPTLLTDAKGVQTRLTYGPIQVPNGIVEGLYPTQTIAAFGTPLARTSASVYDFYTGLVTTATDVDNDVSTITSYDGLGRPLLVRAAAGLPAETQTATQYFDSQRRVVVRSDLDTTGDLKLASIQHYDQLGRIRLTRRLENFSTAALTDETIGIKVQTRYLISNPCAPANDSQCLADNKSVLGSYVLTSNPYRAATSGAASAEATMGWTRSKADIAGRTSEVQTFAGSALPAPWGGNSTSTGTVATVYDGMFTTVMDQAGKVRRSKVDGLGRLIRVDEPSDAANTLGSQGSPTQATNYQYDALGNLTLVTQGSQTRSFSYSSLGRLLSASNPESGVIDYEYDANGNLTKKIDPRLIPNTSTRRSITYTYDDLGRVTARAYNDGTPNVSYSYDAVNVAFSKGRLTAVSSSVSSYSYGEYDPLGPVKTATQTTDGQAYTMSYSYNAAGALISQTYPSGRVVTTNYDEAGRIAGVKNNAILLYYAGAVSSDATNRLQYSAGGGIEAVKLGNGLWEHTNFNSRLQVTQIGLGTSSTDSSKLKLDYTYGVLVNGAPDATKNNGNVLSQTLTLPNLVLTQSYTYDELNRLKSAQEVNGAAQVWRQAYSYDRFGNRRFDAANTTLPQITSQNETSTNPAISSANNRVTAAGYRYDLAGNLECDPTHPCGSTTPFPAYYQFDGDNRITTVNGGASAGGATYVYDGEGRRVEKIIGGATPRTTVFVYDIAGQMIAEYSDQQPTGGGTSYLTADHLGTPRVITRADGSVSGRHDYQPFGEEIPASYGGRASVEGYPPSDGLRQKFTLKERDTETELDNFLARYYSSRQGRFLSPDEFAEGAVEVFAAAAQSNPTFYADVTNPQTLNKYGYCINNPLRFIDPLGHQQQAAADALTLWLQSMIRELLKGKQQYPEEKERRGPLSFDADDVNAKVTQAAGEAAKARADLLRMTGLDFGTLDLIESTIKGDVKGAAVGAVLFAANTTTAPVGKSVVIGENMAARVIPVATEIGAKTYKPTSKIAANWLANNARWISSQIAKGNRIFDIGLDVNRAASKYYAKEVEVLIKRGFERVRVGTVKVGEQTFEVYEWVKAK